MTTATPAVPGRPGTVRTASLLLYLLALLQLASAAVSLAVGQKMTKEAVADVYVDAGMARDLADTTATFVPIAMYVGLALAVIFGVLYLVLGTFVGKGKQWARITTWIIGGIGLCCGAAGLAGNSLSGFGSSGQAGFDQEQAQRAIEGLVPAWTTTASYVLGGISIVMLLLVIILLALPPSHPYFSKPAPEWTPPPTTPTV